MFARYASFIVIIQNLFSSSSLSSSSSCKLMGFSCFKPFKFAHSPHFRYFIIVCCLYLIWYSIAYNTTPPWHTHKKPTHRMSRIIKYYKITYLHCYGRFFRNKMCNRYLEQFEIHLFVSCFVNEVDRVDYIAKQVYVMVGSSHSLSLSLPSSPPEHMSLSFVIPVFK